MNILVQFPTRERPARFAEAYRALATNATPFGFQTRIIVDDDDTSMIQHLAGAAVFGEIDRGPRVSKIEACNRGLKDYQQPWDIVVLISDDMLCQVKGWDDIIRADMQREFPDTDGCLWYPDGHQQNLCTLAVMGRKAFEMDGYIYRPEYKSLWADTEWTDLWSERGRLWRSDQQLFTHMHPGWGTAKMDKLYTVNNRFDREDHATYLRRKAYNFPA